MCGIYCIFGESLGPGHLLLNARGPDQLAYWNHPTLPLHMAFHRLRIQGNTPEAMQPFINSQWTVMCNGEIFNHADLGTTKSGSDCEVLLDMLSQHSPGELCCHLDAEFAFIAWDNINNKIIVARDPYGVRPLYMGRTSTGGIVWASELKSMTDICDHVEQFRPGHYMIFNCDTNSVDKYISYNIDNIYLTLKDAVRKRIQPGLTCCLLSGGLDSSLVASLTQSMMEDQLHTFSIGLPGSPDLEWARKVSDHIGSTHHQVLVSEREFLDAIPHVIATIETWDRTTIRASVGNYLIAKYIKENTNFRVVLNGDYADEVCGGYKYLRKAPSPGDFLMETKNLINNIHFYDSLRSDRCISGCGLEARAPFADKAFVRLYQSLDPRDHSPPDCMEKWWLRKAFMDKGLLPYEVLLRSKEAFSDGVSPEGRSWGQVIKEWLGGKDESEYYITTFSEIFGRHVVDTIPGEWMPKWSPETQDPSARTLSNYQ